MSHTFDQSNDFQKNINFKKKWIAAHQTINSDQSLEQAIESIKVLEESSIFSNEILVVSNTKYFKPVFVSKNVEKVLGYTQEEFLSWDEGAFLKIGNYKQPEFSGDLLKWEGQFKNNNPHVSINLKGRGHICGVAYLHKDGTVRKLLARHEINLSAGFVLPVYDIVYLQDITHLVKGNDYWMMFETFNDKDSYLKFYRKEGVDNFPITPREKEILILIATGKSTKEVANELNISPETVGQHRKNMIKRTMAKDTSALIQLCKMCEII